MSSKTIHYCWFGGKPLPSMAIKCIASWKKYFPSYEIKEWNEANYDVHKIPYTSEAYNARKYAFVSDYARFDILYQYGGLYFDTDVEVIKSFDDILMNGGFIGLEFHGGVATGLGMGCNAGLNIVYQILNSYAGLHFLKEDGTHNLKTVVEYTTDILKRYGLKEENILQEFDGFILYPAEFFCPMDYRTGNIFITDNTHSIHHYEGSWVPEERLFADRIRRKVYAILGDNFLSEIVTIVICVLTRIRKRGLVCSIKYYYSEYKYVRPNINI